MVCRLWVRGRTNARDRLFDKVAAENSGPSVAAIKSKRFDGANPLAMFDRRRQIHGGRVFSAKHTEGRELSKFPGATIVEVALKTVFDLRTGSIQPFVGPDGVYIKDVTRRLLSCIACQHGEFRLELE